MSSKRKSSGASSSSEPKTSERYTVGEQGRKKIVIKPIAEERNRQVTFMKRKQGLMKKAMELSILCECDVAVIIMNQQTKLFEYASEGMDDALRRRNEWQGPRDSKTNEDMRETLNKTNAVAQKANGQPVEDVLPSAADKVRSGGLDLGNAAAAWGGQVVGASSSNSAPSPDVMRKLESFAPAAKHGTFDYDARDTQSSIIPAASQPVGPHGGGHHPLAPQAAAARDRAGGISPDGGGSASDANQAKKRRRMLEVTIPDAGGATGLRRAGDSKEAAQGAVQLQGAVAGVGGSGSGPSPDFNSLPTSPWRASLPSVGGIPSLGVGRLPTGSFGTGTSPSGYLPDIGSIGSPSQLLNTGEGIDLSVAQKPQWPSSPSPAGKR